ncbi:BTB/POZ domain-containing protein [Nemania sp. NC0429]|nr:BTB/POZ domain-containing protein [Nemania sp. NC0429]
MTDSRQTFLEGISKLFNNPDHADVKIFIGEHELPAHSVVIASQSPFFEKALNGSFRESKAKQFLFKEGSAHAHWRVFEYLYTGDYADEANDVLGVPDDNELIKHVRVYTTAEFFMLDNLKQIALQRFKAHLEGHWISDRLFDCIREVYSHTVDSEDVLRRAVVEVVCTCRAELWKKKEFRALIYDGGDFAVDLMGSLSGDSRPFRKRLR